MNIVACATNRQAAYRREKERADKLQEAWLDEGAPESRKDAMSDFITKEGHPAIQGVEGGPWFSPSVNPFKHGCCDCGLMHGVEYALVNEAGEPVEMPEGLRLALRFSTDHEETARLREYKKAVAEDVRCDACGEAISSGQKNVGHECDLHEGCVSVEYPPYLPYCGTEMCQFASDFCDNCADPDEMLWNEKQEGTGCKFIIEATAENKQPEPWVVKDGKAHCLNFRKQNHGDQG